MMAVAAPYDIDHLATLLVTFAVITAVIQITLLPAPYGKLDSSRDDEQKITKQWWRIGKVPARWAWMIMESPSALLPIAIYVWPIIQNVGSYIQNEDQQRWKHLPNHLLCFMFVGHYLIRAFVYPLLLRNGRPVPLAVPISAFCFTAFNGYLQSYALLQADYDVNYIFLPRFLIGTTLFLVGFGINQQSDHLLRNLRKVRTDSAYFIPHGGLFEYISAPNYLGEIVEWFGYAIASNTWPAMAFALFTLAQLGCRAFQYHQWYIKKFGAQIPAQRKALIPFVL